MERFTRKTSPLIKNTLSPVKTCLPTAAKPLKATRLYKCMLLYHDEATEKARSITEYVEGNNIAKVYYRQRDLLIGSITIQEIAKAICDSEVVLLLLCPRYNVDYIHSYYSCVAINRSKPLVLLKCGINDEELLQKWPLYFLYTGIQMKEPLEQNIENWQSKLRTAIPQAVQEHFCRDRFGCAFPCINTKHHAHSTLCAGSLYRSKPLVRLAFGIGDLLEQKWPECLRSAIRVKEQLERQVDVDKGQRRATLLAPFPCRYCSNTSRGSGELAEAKEALGKETKKFEEKGREWQKEDRLMYRELESELRRKEKNQLDMKKRRPSEVSAQYLMTTCGSENAESYLEVDTAFPKCEPQNPEFHRKDDEAGPEDMVGIVTIEESQTLKSCENIGLIVGVGVLAGLVFSLLLFAIISSHYLAKSLDDYCACIRSTV